MSAPVAVLVLLVVLVAVAGLYVAVVYNALVGLRNRAENAWSQIDVQLKRRRDLVPNLVETVKGYAGHEQEVLTHVAEARSRAQSADRQGDLGQLAAAESLLGQALGRLFAVAEAYPDLKANQNFLALQEELSSTENRIAFARQAYNDAVMRLNTKIESFPANLVAGPFGFTRRSFFELEDPSEREVPEVKF
jgi:LemA protein